MKNNIVSVLLWGKEVCKLKWEGGYRLKFGKVGSMVSFNSEYAEGFNCPITTSNRFSEERYSITFQEFAMTMTKTSHS